MAPEGARTSEGLSFSGDDTKLRRLIAEALDRHRVPLAHRGRELLDLSDGWGLVPDKAWNFLDPDPALDLVAAAIRDGVRIQAPEVDDGGAVAWNFPQDREPNSLRVRLSENWMGDQKLEVLDIGWTLGEWKLDESWPLIGEFQLDLAIESYRGASGYRYASLDLEVEYDGMGRTARVAFEFDDGERTLELCSPGLDSRTLDPADHPDLVAVFEHLRQSFAAFHEEVVPLMVR
jgi:hypothetical protein